MVWFNTLFSVIVVSLLSFSGALLFLMKKERSTHFLLYLVSFSVGALLGDVFIHILPEIVEKERFSASTGLYFLIGIVIFFAIEKFANWHHCHDLEHTHHLKKLAYTNLIGDGLHNFIDGMIIAGAYLISFPLGLATTLAVVFHEIPQEIGDLGVLMYSGMSRVKALLFNFLSACLALLGAIVTLIVVENVENLLVVLLAIAGGGFIYIAGSDLIPELHKECKFCRSIYQLLFIVGGMALMWGLKLVG
ncbi:MAG: ZIP family metal transporter [Patescibacteria group bacterium]